MWQTTDIKPNAMEPVLLFRTYGPKMVLKKQTGFRSYGIWDGKNWCDEIFHCIVDDVKFWHPSPALPPGEFDSNAME